MVAPDVQSPGTRRVVVVIHTCISASSLMIKHCVNVVFTQNT